MSRTMYDSTTIADIPADAEMVAYYPHAFPGDIAKFPNAAHVTIDNNGSDPTLDVLDVESGAASVADAPGWLDEHEKEKGYAGTLYCNRSTLPALVKAVGTRLAYLWIADPDGKAHAYEPVPKLPDNITQVATQYAWPNYGSGGHYDISLVTRDTWFKQPALVIPPATTEVKGIVITDALKTYSVTSKDEKTWAVG